MSQNIEHGTDSNFEDLVINSDVPVLVDFWAPWCAPCRAVAPVLEEIANENDGQVKVVKVNIDEETRVAAELGVRSIPTIALYHQGKVVDQVVGARPKDHFEALIAKTRPN